MAPSLREGARVLACTFARFRLGDVVICRNPEQGKETVKRIVGIVDNQYRVEGDNLTRSTDSRHYGLLSQGELIARVWWQMYPQWKCYL